MNESQTQLECIEPALKAAGWGVVEGSRIYKEYPISQGRLIGQGRKEKPSRADYVLIYKNRRLAVIEAKKRDAHYTLGLAQAKDYAQRLNVRYTYATNGLKIYGVDLATAKEGDVPSYPSPDVLWNMTFAEANHWRDKLLSIPFVLVGGKWQPRYYQQNAIESVIEAITSGQDRILLTMATGTGKTGTAFQIVWKLFETRWNLTAKKGAQYYERLPRILFLADRNILANQAFLAFNNAFEDEALSRITPADIRKKGKVPKNHSIFFTIFQSFMSGPEDTPYFGQYPADFFDFIIIDECHRGGATDESSWRAIMEYFSPAVQLGLTATPKRKNNGDTYKYFGDPVYQYSLKEGINDGFLSPFRVKEIRSTIMGSSKDDEQAFELKPDDVVMEGEASIGDKFTEKQFNRLIEIKGREEFRVKTFMDLIDQNEKTLVFCSTQVHALAVRDLINQYSKSYSPDYCVRVTADDGKLGEDALKMFQDNERSIPTILTTSQKLSTGVDAPEIRNIVLLRTVNSMIEFKQIVGRGTRLFDGKDYFTIYDFVEAHEHFNDPEWDGPPLPLEEPKTMGGRTCKECDKSPCECSKDAVDGFCEECQNDPCVCDKTQKKMIKVQLGRHRMIELDATIQTSFWSADGTPMSSDAFVEKLFGDIPSFFKNEEELRKLWSKPDTRKKLLEELSDKGYTHDQLEELRKIVHGQDSDLYDVLSFIAYHSDMVPRSDRAGRAKVQFDSYDPAQQEFLNFVLKQYVDIGVSELDDQKLPEILELKYHAISDAKSKLGSIADIRKAFIGVQEKLYAKKVG